MTRAALLLALLTGACASASPAPISYGDSGARAEAPAPQRAERRTPAPIERRTPTPRLEEQRASPAPQRAPPEQPNWADGEGTPLSAYALQPGDVQPFDPANLPRSHHVSGDESVYDIATRYQVPLRALIDQNRLEPPYGLAAGRVLELPPPRYHVVRRGEDLGDIARRYNVDLRSLALLNRLQPTADVGAGERIYLPAMAREMAQEATPAPIGVGASAPSGSGRFSWPLRGEVVSRFGAQPGGTRLDGIEIAGREGASVAAAADGDVIYAGDDIEALGFLVLVRHADNYVTAYAYNRRALVREGQRVRAGEGIAELGARPDGRARLLFQVRRGSDVLDPAPLMGAQR
ncbi:peptidoglycan DD-metalloendopeptidase family protein [Candidatus Viadribacter manganicus]|nr:peptidoglycan DD-metalloendopeptidase family protein [Candidatus Viadribacter manganicus]